MMYVIEDIQRELADVFAADEVWPDAGGVTFRGRLLMDSRTAFALARQRLKPRGLLPLLRRARTGTVLRVVPYRERLHQRFPLLQVVLLLATLVSTMYFGARFAGVESRQLLNLVMGLPFDMGAFGRELAAGMPFSFTLLGILGAHELAHYVAGRRHGTVLSVPYFIPFPNLLGTGGAIIKMRSPVRDRSALADIGASGPLAGFVLAVVATAVGFRLSGVVAVDPEGGGLSLGSSVITAFLREVVRGDIGAGNTLALHPVGAAGYFGLLVTAVNLLPVGQLDGGHVSYALFARGHRAVAVAAVLALVVLARQATLIAGELGLIWAVVVVALCIFVGLGTGFRHPVPLDDVTEPRPRRKAVCWAVAGVFMMSFVPVPLMMNLPA